MSSFCEINTMPNPSASVTDLKYTYTSPLINRSTMSSLTSFTLICSPSDLKYTYHGISLNSIA